MSNLNTRALVQMQTGSCMFLVCPQEGLKIGGTNIAKQGFRSLLKQICELPVALIADIVEKSWCMWLAHHCHFRMEMLNSMENEQLLLQILSRFYQMQFRMENVLANSNWKSLTILLWRHDTHHHIKGYVTLAETCVNLSWDVCGDVIMI